MVMASAGPDGEPGLARAYACCASLWNELVIVVASGLVQIGACDGLGPRVRELYATLWIGYTMIDV